MFKKHKTKSGTTSSNWLLSQDHPVPALEDKLPLTKDLGDLSSLPPSHQEPVRDAFIQNLCDAACYQNQSELDWFNTKKKPSYRVKKFIDFVTMLPERYLSPKAGPIIDLWLPIPHIHRLMELVPRQFANGWKQMEIENMLIVLLDHGNNQDVRVLGFYTLCLYMVTMKDDYSETTTDLFTNAICLRALSYVDMPDASLIVSNIMCAIGSGIEAVDIGCGQRAIPPRTRHVRRVPILGLRLLIDFMLNNLVPRYEYMISDMDFFVPFVEKSPHDTSKCWVERFPGMDDQTLADIQSIKVHTYDSLRYLMLDCDLDSGRFFIDILRLSLQVFSDTSSLGVPNDNFDLGLVLDTNYSVCLGSLTIVRIWLASKEEYRPVHLLTDRNDAHMLSNVIADYAEHVYGLLDWLVEDNTWDEKKCLILGIFGLGGQVDEMVLKLRDLYSTKTSWTNHLNVWCNVLHALTIARGRHILNVEERVLIQESMFSGQRQRKGLSKVDAYLNRMKVPTYHLEMDDLHDILGTATPFNTTSNLVWDTMRLVFDNVKSAAQKECDSAEKIASLLKESSGKTWSASSGALEHLSQTPCGIYTRIIASNPKALVQIGNNINKDILIQVQSRKTAPQRVYRMQSSRNRNAEASQHEPQTVLAPLEKAQSHNIESAKAKNKTVQRNTADVPKKPSIWHKIKQPFRKGKSSVVSAQPRDRYLESADISRSNLPPSADQNNEINSYRTSTEASRKAPDKVKTNNTRNRAALLQSPARDYDRQHMPVASWEGMSTQSRSSSMVSVTMERHIQQPHPVGPAFISAELPGTHLNVKQAYHHHSKTGLRSTSSTDSQKTEVAISNAKAAAALLGDISTRIWQLEGIWVDFHISEFVYTQNNTVKDLQKMWLVWVHLLGNPIDADETHSKIILRGMVMSWDVYRAVLDCSRYAPDNDDVMLNTSWWIAEMATIYSIDDYRGRLAQLAMFRIGCHGSDHISSRVLFLRSRFLQTALITLSTLAKDHAINIDQVQVFLVECKLVLSLGISGSQLMLLTIYRGLRRIFLYHSTYEGVFSDQAIQSAATLLVSMTTMLGVTRVLSLNHHLEKAQKLFECNMVDDAEIQGMFSNVKDGVERCEYPIIYDPLGSRQYRAEWVDGGPVWTRNLTMHIMKAIAEHFDRSAHNVTIGKAVVIREMITLLTTIIIKTPELITREDSHVEGADARSIRDFLIEKVILSCADPTSERTGNEHRFNQRLVQEYSNHGLVLKLVQAQYSTSKSMSMEEFMTKSEDEHRYSGNAIESIKQAGEVLYVTLLQQFDEFDRSRYQGAPGSEPDSEQLVFHEATSMPNSIKEPRQLNKQNINRIVEKYIDSKWTMFKEEEWI
ncbi:hypothetical protein EV178_004239 [Coemansia sp. RSA 1646]|nr:hypothetical protein EV178_004239 [Coemansia sp. RSA 1646]